MIDAEFVIQTDSPEATESIGQIIGQSLKGGELIELASDLGGGKTTFTRGLVRGVESQDRVASPTFTISREYSGGRLHVYHFDLYRLMEAGVVGEELYEATQDENGVVVVEWAGIASGVLSGKHITIKLVNQDENRRHITVSAPDHPYVIERLKA